MTESSDCRYKANGLGSERCRNGSTADLHAVLLIVLVKNAYYCRAATSDNLTNGTQASLIVWSKATFLIVQQSITTDARQRDSTYANNCSSSFIFPRSVLYYSRVGVTRTQLVFGTQFVHQSIAAHSSIINTCYYKDDDLFRVYSIVDLNQSRGRCQLKRRRELG